MIIPKAKDIIEQEFMKLIFLLFFFISSCLSFSSTALTEHTVSLFWLLTIQLYLFSKFVTEEYLKNSSYTFHPHSSAAMVPKTKKTRATAIYTVNDSLWF